MRILVTGLNGFTGRYLKQELELHHHEIIRLQSNLMNQDAVFNELREITIDAVVHLAAIAFVGHGNIQDFYQVNLLGTLNLLEAIYRYAPNIKSVLLASTSNIYGNNKAEVLFESTCPNPTNDYAISKLAMEQMAMLWKERLPIFITRPFNYTGVGQSENFIIPKIIAHFQKNLSAITLGNIDVYREFNDVRMIVKIYHKLLEISPVGEIINICSGKNYSLSRIIQICEKLTGHKIAITVNPKFIRNNEIKSLVGSNTKLQKLIGDWEEFSIEDTLHWMMNHNDLVK